MELALLVVLLLSIGGLLRFAAAQWREGGIARLLAGLLASLVALLLCVFLYFWMGTYYGWTP